MEHMQFVEYLVFGAVISCYISSVSAQGLPTTTSGLTPSPPPPTSTGRQATTSPGPKVCDIAERSPNQRLDAIERAFNDPQKGCRRVLDLAFIIDRSESIDAKAFEETKNAIKQLLVFLSERRYNIIHRFHTRVAVVSFGIQATVVFDGISDERKTIDACEFEKRIDDLTIVNDKTNESKISEAIYRVQEIFSISRADPKRSNADQILWIFFDGDSGNDNDPNYHLFKGKSEQGWAEDLRKSGVRIFAAGVGQWLMINVERERKVVELATDEDHYACASTWLKIIPSGSENQQPLSTCRAPLFSEITSAYQSECASCPTREVCACQVTSRKYTCTDEPLVLLTETEVVDDDSGASRGGAPPWLLPVAIASSVVGFILLIILLVVLPLLVVRRNKKKKEEELYYETQPIYGGPDLPPPPVPRRKKAGTPKDMNNIYANYGEPERPRSISSSTSDISGQSPNEVYELGDYNTIIYPQSYENVEALENDMIGWPGYLSDMKQSKHLQHLTIRSIPTNRWAMTANANFNEKDIREVEKILRQGSENKLRKVKIAGKSYDLDQEETSHLHLHGTRLNRRGEKETLWVSKVYDYVVLGTAMYTEDDECSRAVYDIHRHLQGMIEQSGNIRGGDGSLDYGMVGLPARFSRMSQLNR